jgi:hypothetical protein
VHSQTELAAYAVGRIAKRLLETPGVRILQRGDKEVRVAFQADRLDAIAAILGAHRRPVLSDEERARRAESARSMRKPPVLAAP